MKKFYSIVSLLLAATTLTACNNVSPKDEFAGLKFVSVPTDRIVYDSLEEVEEQSDLIVVGKFTDKAAQKTDYKHMPQDDKDVVWNVTSTNSVKISRVLKGDKEVGDEIKVSVYYGVVDDQLITFSSLTPMQKGDEWVFFLKKQDDADMYWHVGDSCGRFPTKNSSGNSAVSFSENSDLGVYDEDEFKSDIYNELVKKYDV